MTYKHGNSLWGFGIKIVGKTIFLNSFTGSKTSELAQRNITDIGISAALYYLSQASPDHLPNIYRTLSSSDGPYDPGVIETRLAFTGFDMRMPMAEQVEQATGECSVDLKY